MRLIKKRESEKLKPISETSIEEYVSLRLINSVFNDKPSSLTCCISIRGYYVEARKINSSVVWIRIGTYPPREWKIYLFDDALYIKEIEVLEWAV